ncbi:uncharacterized protein [Setaria viridis]|uniref:uncharacterized protein n=1 Tax=Setaria viridis TaxID=4556 RepID=UPI0014937A01|nr:uncharacterized protein LOC117849178 [Setaria viridis]
MWFADYLLRMGNGTKETFGDEYVLLPDDIFIEIPSEDICIDPHNGLCNGTRLIVRGFQENSIDAEIVNGQHAGKRVFITRIPMSPSGDLSLPFKFKRKQLPIRLSIAMTINKAQG